MDNDVQNWITHVNINNARKRKAKFDEDDLIKEMTFNSIESILKIIKKEKIKNSKLELFLEGLKFIFTSHPFLTKILKIAQKD